MELGAKVQLWEKTFFFVCRILLMSFPSFCVLALILSLFLLLEISLFVLLSLSRVHFACLLFVYMMDNNVEVGIGESGLVNAVAYKNLRCRRRKGLPDPRTNNCSYSWRKNKLQQTNYIAKADSCEATQAIHAFSEYLETRPADNADIIYTVINGPKGDKQRYKEPGRGLS